MSKRLNRSRNNFSLDINLVEAFGSEVPEDLALAFGQEIIDTILDRTEDNTGSDGRRFKNYSDEYAESLEFLAAGKSKNDPNLELTGDMLFDIDILEATPGNLKIGFTNTLQRDKAYNHHTGDTVPARPFFDLPDGDYERIVRSFKDDVEQRNEPESEAPSAAISLLSLLRDLNGQS